MQKPVQKQKPIAAEHQAEQMIRSHRKRRKCPLDRMKDPIYAAPQYDNGRAQQFPTRRPFSLPGMQKPSEIVRISHKTKRYISWLLHIEYPICRISCRMGRSTFTKKLFSSQSKRSGKVEEGFSGELKREDQKSFERKNLREQHPHIEKAVKKAFYRQSG